MGIITFNHFNGTVVAWPGSVRIGGSPVLDLDLEIRRWHGARIPK
jgi:hypothetical protein